MRTKSDAELLREYAHGGSETAFGEIVVRYTDLIYSAVLRQLGSHDLARDVAQSVLTDLARKAPSLVRKLSEDGTLVGWLYRSSLYTASKYLRDECRRQAREKQLMQDFDSAPETSPDWERLRPVLDEAMTGLTEPDRQAVLLRFFKDEDFHAVGMALGVSDDAAQKRVARALERLRAHLTRRGVTMTAAALSTVISTSAVQTAPVGLAAVLTSTSLASAAAGTGTTLGVLKLMAITKLHLGIISALVVAGVATPLMIQHQAQARLREKDQALQQLSDQLARLATENARFSNLVAPAKNPPSLANDQLSEMARLRAEVTRLRGDSQELAQLKAVNAQKATDPMESAAKALLGKMNLLKQRLEQMPDKRIPELQYLHDHDWALTAQTANLETEADVREALYNLRDQAKQKFAFEMSRTLQKYAQANNGQLPSDVLQLKPYFGSPLDDAILERYQMIKAGNVSDLQPHEMIVAEKAPVDDEYDSLYQIGLSGRRSQGVGKKSGEASASNW